MALVLPCAAVDMDRDGLPDDGEIQNGLNPSSGVSGALVAWWTFDEGTGAVASNAVSTNFTATLVNMAPSNWIAGATARTNDRALWFDGANDCVRVVDLSVGQPSETISQALYSVSALIWFAPSTTHRYPTVFSDAEYSGSGPGYYLRCDDYPTTLQAYRLAFRFKPKGSAGVPEAYGAR